MAPKDMSLCRVSCRSGDGAIHDDGGGDDDDDADDDDDDDGEEVPHFYISKLPIVRLCGCYWY